MEIGNGSGSDPQNNEASTSKSGSGLTKNQIIDIFEASFNELREYLSPIMGSTALSAIFRNAVRENKSRFPFLAGLQTDDSGFSLEPLKNEQITPGELLQAIFEFMQSIIELLTELTGDVLAKKARVLVSDIANQLGEDHDG